MQEFCPKCKAPLILYRSFHKKVCYDCKIEYDWQLKDGQKYLIQHTR